MLTHVGVNLSLGYRGPPLACPVRYQKRPFSNITGDMDEQLSNCHCFSFRLMWGTKQYQMECLFVWHCHTTQGNGRDK